MCRIRRRSASNWCLDLTETFRTDIEAVGFDGDGIGRLSGGVAAYLPFTLPTEQVVARVIGKRGDGWTAAVEAIERASPERAEPPCPLFGSCGGCALQHWQDQPIASWKAKRVANALRRAGFDWTPEPALASARASRRRMDLGIRRLPSGVVIGLHTVGGTAIVPMSSCQVLHPTLLALLPPLRETLDRLAGLRREGSALLNLLDTGPDLLLRHDAPLSTQDRQRLVAFATAHQVPRIAVSQTRNAAAGWEIACQLGPATLAFDQVKVSPPPGAFLQASREGEIAIAQGVCDGLPDRLPTRARVAELYAGCGSLTFRLAKRVRVAAFEGDANSVKCLADAARQAGRISVTHRDLVRQPLAASELAAFAAIVLDPPFGGAAAQMPAIATSGVRRVVYVSCNPAALAQDAAVLARSAYRLVGAIAIDQFVWSPHVESVITFER